MTCTCKGFEEKFKVRTNRACAYRLGYRRCTKCDMYVEGKYLSCPCCHAMTRSRAR